MIDGIDGFRQGAAYPERTIRFITALTNELRALDITVLVTEETQKIFGPDVEVRVEATSASSSSPARGSSCLPMPRARATSSRASTA